MQYEEFGLLAENATEFGIPFDHQPTVGRTFVDVGNDRRLSAISWGSEAPRAVLLHGGAQNAHTWDTVALALGWPLVAIDLPGHGHSDGPRPAAAPGSGYAEDVAIAVEKLAPDASLIVGMSAGGMTAIQLASIRPELVRRLALIDILPNPDPASGRLITDFVDGPDTFASFDDLLARTIEFNPTRSVASLRRGILHNALQLEDGSWQWRHRRHRRPMPTLTAADAAARDEVLWQQLAAIAAPIMLVRGMAHGSVVTDESEARLRREVPAARIEHVADAGHSVQGDQPIRLAGLLQDFVD